MKIDALSNNFYLIVDVSPNILKWDHQAPLIAFKYLRKSNNY